MIAAAVLLIPALALGVSLNAPLGGRAAQDIERLAAVSSLPAVKKPYNYDNVARAAEEIRASHPELYRRLAAELARIPQPAAGHRLALHDLVLEAGFHAEDPGDLSRAIPNRNGRTANSDFAAHGTVFSAPYSGLALSLDADVARRGSDYMAEFPNSYVSCGFPSLQIDLGYRDHWYSPALGGATAISNHAVNSPAVTISNSRPLTPARIMYEMFLSRLESTSQIMVDDTLRTGHPNLLGLHLSFSPLPWLTLGANRLLQFGGEPRKSVSAWDVIRALIDPSRYDNMSGELDRDDEIGNQVGSIAVAANYQLAGFPLRMYWELGADDLGSARMYLFGNPFTTVGFFAPFVTEKMSLRYEYSEGQNRWYEHSIYRDGYRNDGHVMGHWIYDFNAEGYDYQIEAAMHALTFVWTDSRLEVVCTGRRVSAELLRAPHPIQYSPGYEIDVAVRRQVSKHLDARFWLYTGATPREQTFTTFTVGLGMF